MARNTATAAAVVLYRVIYVLFAFTVAAGRPPSIAAQRTLTKYLLNSIRNIKVESMHTHIRQVQWECLSFGKECRRN